MTYAIICQKAHQNSLKTKEAGCCKGYENGLMESPEKHLWFWRTPGVGLMREHQVNSNTNRVELQT
jgi:hypothetical protein